MKERENPRVTPCNQPTGRAEQPPAEMGGECCSSRPGADKPPSDVEMCTSRQQLTCKSEFPGKAWAGGINLKVTLGQVVLRVIRLNEITWGCKSWDWAWEPPLYRLNAEKNQQGSGERVTGEEWTWPKRVVTPPNREHCREKTADSSYQSRWVRLLRQTFPPTTKQQWKVLNKMHINHNNIYIIISNCVDYK